MERTAIPMEERDSVALFNPFLVKSLEVVPPVTPQASPKKPDAPLNTADDADFSLPSTTPTQSRSRAVSTEKKSPTAISSPHSPSRQHLDVPKSPKSTLSLKHKLPSFDGLFRLRQDKDKDKEKEEDKDKEGGGGEAVGKKNSKEEDTKKAKKASKALEKSMKKDYALQQQIYRVLVLGSGSDDTRLLFKQILSTKETSEDSDKPARGIREEDLVIDGKSYHLIDVCGQKNNERKKWMHAFSDVNAILFVTSLSAYDNVLYEDLYINRMQEALQQWDEICNSKWFKKIPAVLFFTHRDEFKDKLQNTPLTKCFPEYSGPNTYESTAKFIQEQFEKKNRNLNKPIATHFLGQSDTNVTSVFGQAMKDIVMRDA